MNIYLWFIYKYMWINYISHILIKFYWKNYDKKKMYNIIFRIK